VLKPRPVDVAFGALALLLALAVKAFYSHAGASALAFVLVPSCWLAAHLGGVDELSDLFWLRFADFACGRRSTHVLAHVADLLRAERAPA